MLLYNTACPERSCGMEIFSFQYIKGEVNTVVGIKMDPLKSYFIFFAFFLHFCQCYWGSISYPKSLLGTNPFLFMIVLSPPGCICHVLPVLSPVSFARKPPGQVPFMQCTKNIAMFSLPSQTTKTTSVAFIWCLCHLSNNEIRLCPWWPKRSPT